MSEEEFLEQIDFAIENGDYEYAYELAMGPDPRGEVEEIPWDFEEE